MSYYTELMMENITDVVEYNDADGFVSLEKKKGYYEGMSLAFDTIAMMIENGEMNIEEGGNY